MTHPLPHPAPPAQDSGKSQLRVFDRAAMMTRLMGDEELCRVITRNFLLDIPQRMEKLRGCLAAADATGAVFQAHAIKGASASVGGNRLRQAALKIEHVVRADDFPAAAECVVALDACFQELKQAMTEEP